jgi:hypothetical protein
MPERDFFRVKSNMPPIVQDAIQAYGYTELRLRVPRPTAQQISRMDEALGWVSLIPASPITADPVARNGGATLRRIVHCRLMVRPMSWYQTPNRPTYLFSWRAIGGLLGADYRAVQGWHGAALATILAALKRRQAA